MKRLTYYLPNGTWGVDGIDLAKLPAKLYACLAKLKDYENSGKTPDECQISSPVHSVDPHRSEHNDHGNGEERERLAQISDYNEEFDRLRRNRVEVARYKYGPARDNFGAGRVDALATADRCLDAFRRDHNSEHLLDAANYLMFRFAYPLPGDYFQATDSDGSVGTVGVPINFE